jgi:hypothetical protein
MQTHLDSIDSLLNDFQLARPAGTLDSLWAFNEFSSADFKDLRLTRRLQQLARDFSTQPMASIPQACGGWACAKAAYRFCSNPKVGFENILAAHQARTLERVGIHACPVVLCPQDTTTLNYLSHPATQGLGHLGTKRGHSLGLMLHSTLAVDPQGRFHGLLGAHCWARPKGKTPRRRSNQKESILKKETARWLQSYREVERLARLHPQHLWVSVTDREGDIYEVFNEATGAGQCAGLLVRARHDRSLLDYPQQTLFEHARELKPAGIYVAHVPRDQGRAAREATLSISFERVRLAPPRYHEKEPAITLWVVLAREIGAPDGVEPIQWCLLTTVPTHTLADAIERVQWYVRRWLIEEFHRVLKSGCQVQARQLRTRERLQRALAIDMVVAWRIMDLNKAARLEPQAPADKWLSAEEWQSLYCYVKKTAHPPAQPPSISQAVLWLAQLGGFLNRKSDGRPGATTLWRGLQRLKDIVEAWKAFGPAVDTPGPHAKKRGKRCG